MLRLGVEGKAAGWRTLRVLATATSGSTLPGWMSSSPGRRQADLLGELRVRAASQVIGTDRAAGGS